MRKQKYFATIENDQGAGAAIDFQTYNKRVLKDYIRAVHRLCSTHFCRRYRWRIWGNRNV